jgi:hypothetical protein
MCLGVLGLPLDLGNAAQRKQRDPLDGHAARARHRGVRQLVHEHGGKEGDCSDERGRPDGGAAPVGVRDLERGGQEKGMRAAITNQL